MAHETVDPATGKRVASYPELDQSALDCALGVAAVAAAEWREVPLAGRRQVMVALAGVLRSRREVLAGLMTLEMGKLQHEGLAEVDKCAAAAEYCADHAPAWLEDQSTVTDATRSYVAWQPLGTVLAVMPWNFPFWQVIRCAVPALLGGNTVLLKHASNVPQCARALEEIFLAAGLPAGAFSTLLIDNDQVADVIADARVHAVALTGSERAGRAVAAAAGRALKKCVLELGGSDPFVVLEDADINRAAEVAVTARFQNAGQSCIAAKRFIVVEAVHDAFLSAFTTRVRALELGTKLAPMARVDLRDGLHQQVLDSVAAGATCVLGGSVPERAGAWYPATVLTDVRSGMPAADEELFGPVAAVLRVTDEDAALAAAGATPYGLGAAVWTADVVRGERFARLVPAGMTFVNDMVRSDPRLPFGGIKASGFGRELTALGMREFLNAKTVWVH